MIFRVTKWLIWILIVISALVIGQFIGLTLYRRHLSQKRIRDELEPLNQLPPNLQKLLLVHESEIELHNGNLKTSF